MVVRRENVQEPAAGGERGCNSTGTDMKVVPPIAAVDQQTLPGLPVGEDGDLQEKYRR